EIRQGLVIDARANVVANTSTNASTNNRSKANTVTNTGAIAIATVKRAAATPRAISAPALGQAVVGMSMLGLRLRLGSWLSGSKSSENGGGGNDE
ncbi:hypothetical protein GGH92_010018, partial [Coemansia sp. RSA 2673]